MMKKDFFKKLGIVGVSFALISSPLAFADMHEEDEPKTGTKQESDLDKGQNISSTTGSDSEAQDATDITAEDEPNTGTRQESDLDNSQGSMNSSGTDASDQDATDILDDDEPKTGTTQESDLDDE